MNDIIRGMIDGYLSIFNQYSASGELEKEIEDFKRRFEAFAEKNSDPAMFYQKFTESGLQEEYNSLITKAAMSEITANNNSQEYAKTEADVISVSEFVDQYRTPYDEIKKAGYRKRAEKAYEAIFEVANRTTDMVEAQLIFEKERLLWNIVKEDALDIFEPVLAAMDPLNKATTANLILQIETYEKVQSDEELTAETEKQEKVLLILVQQEIIKITLAATLATHLLKYHKAKLKAGEFGADNEVQGAMMAILANKKALQRTLTFLKDNLSLSFNDLLQDEGMKIWLLAPTNVDALSRIKIALHPKNYDAYLDIIENEIEKDLSVKEILLRKIPAGIYFALDGKAKKEFERKASLKAEELNRDLVYYQYQKELETALKRTTNQ
jgi:hypothetical protein